MLQQKTLPVRKTLHIYAAIKKVRPTLKVHDEVKSVAYAATSVVSWTSLMHHTLFDVMQPSEKALCIPVMTFLYTSMFIVGHDSMHGSICPTFPTLNDMFGKTAMTLYACFDYDEMRKKHMLHHAHTGIPNEDPDFHKRQNNESHLFVKWYFDFMTQYMNLKQLAFLMLTVYLLQWCGASQADLLLFMGVPGMLSGMQLFYFGTYLPHCPPFHTEKEKAYRTMSSCLHKNRLMSYIQCLHFDCHIEHHENPNVPWWKLWNTYKVSKTTK